MTATKDIVKLEETKDRRVLHIGSHIIVLNETDYRALKKIFGPKTETYSCRHCDKKFTDEYELEAHVQFNHK